MRRHNQTGMASLVVTVVLISLLSAVAVAFSVIMNRELQRSLNNQLGQAAYNAAASGINDSISFLRDNPNTNVTQCSDLVGSGKPLNAASNLSGDGNTKYTCALINTKPLDIVYQAITSNQSQVIRTSFSAPAGKMMVSWQATNRGYNNFVPSAQAGQLFDETAWLSAKDTPMLKVSLYPVPADTKDASYATANSKTFYLYPIKASGFSVNALSYAATSGSLQPVECGLKNLNGAFNGSADYDCSLIINNLPTANPAGYMYYIRLTPIYGAADVKIRANDATASSAPVSFVGTQAIIDVTAQSSNAVKRLQARVDISGLSSASQNITSTDDAFPEYALRSANAVCKRLYNTNSVDFPAYINSDTINYCGFDQSGFDKLVPPTVNGSCSSAGDYSNANCSFSINPKNGRITYCKLLIDGSEVANCISLFPATHSNQPQTLSGTYNLGSGEHSYSLCADNPAGKSNPCATGNFTIPTPTPPPAFLSSFTQDTNCVYGGVRHGNCYNFTGNNLAAWPCTYTIDGGQSQSGYSLNGAGTAGSFTYGNDGVVAKTGNITCGSASCNLNAADCTNVPPVPSGGGVSVAIGIPSGFGQYAFSWSVTRPNAPNDCRDDAHHTFIGCFDITASQNGDYSKIERCAVNTDTGNAYSYGLSAFSTFHRASIGHWIDVTVGWPGTSVYSLYSTTGASVNNRGMPGADGNGNATVTVICYAFDGSSGTDSKTMHWNTCYDVGKDILHQSWEGTYYTDVASNGCSSPRPN